MRRRNGWRWLAWVVVAGLATACASTPIGEVVQTAEGQKIAVESAADEIILLKLRKDRCVTQAGTDAAKQARCAALPSLSPADYARARGAYEKWAAAQAVFIEALATWQRAKTTANDAKVQDAVANLGPALTAAADMVCTFKASSTTLVALCAKMGR